MANKDAFPWWTRILILGLLLYRCSPSKGPSIQHRPRDIAPITQKQIPRGTDQGILDLLKGIYVKPPTDYFPPNQSPNYPKHCTHKVVGSQVMTQCE